MTDKELEFILQGYETSFKKTIFIDIDGTILLHRDGIEEMLKIEPIILPGVISQLEVWKNEGSKVIIVSARPERARQRTKEQLVTVGIVEGNLYSELIMGVTAGERWMVNDEKPTMSITCRAFTIKRDEGFPKIL